MYPTVRPGDVLHIQSRAAAEVAVGDIAVCRAPNFLFSHRVIAKSGRDGRSCIITRPDRLHDGSDPPTFDENLLGVVDTITRNGKPVPLQPAAYSWLVRRYYAAYLALISAEQRGRALLVTALAHLQNKGLYRSIARWLFALKRPRVSYTVHLPLNAQFGDSVHRRVESDEFDVRMEWKGRPVERWTLALHLNGARQPAAWATLVRGGGNSWRVEESYVRVRYRGAGFEDALLSQAEKILAKGR